MRAEAVISPQPSKKARTTAETAAAREVNRARMKLSGDKTLFSRMWGMRPRYAARAASKSEPNALSILFSRSSVEVSATHGRVMAQIKKIETTGHTELPVSLSRSRVDLLEAMISLGNQLQRTIMEKILGVGIWNGGRKGRKDDSNGACNLMQRRAIILVGHYRFVRDIHVLSGELKDSDVRESNWILTECKGGRKRRVG